MSTCNGELLTDRGMSRIVINNIEYTDEVDKRFYGCEFCDVRIKDYAFYEANCFNKPRPHPCGDADYLKRV